MRAVRIVLWLAVATVAGLSAGYFLFGQPEPQQPLRSAEEVARDLINGRFSLIDHTGAPVTEKTYDGTWRLVFFGYTHCPDVCPTTLGTIALIMDELGEDAAQVTPLFITVDPARDTPALLADYVVAFHPRIVGLTGSDEQIAATARNFRAYYAKSKPETDDDPDSYGMDHTAYLYLMLPDGSYGKAFSPVDTVETIVREMRARFKT